ncbi:MAG: hypothetical protein K6G47_09725 [Clostridia bacterium]|nr:hypothetical protein [Clostridia bacterium]
MILGDNVKNVKTALSKPLAVIFYALFAYFFNYHFMVSTMLFRTHLNIYNPTFVKIYDFLFYVLVGLAVASVLVFYEGIRDRIYPIVVIAVVLLFNRGREITTLKAISAFFLLVIAAKNKNIKIWGRIAFYCGWAWMIGSFIATRVGFIPDLTYDNGARHAFGIIYPTDLGCHILTLSMVLCFIRNGKLKIYDYIYLALMMAINILFIKAKVSFGCMFLLFCGSLYAQYIHPRRRLNQGVVQAYNAVCVLAFAFFAILTFALTLSYSPNSGSIFNKIGFLGSIKSRFRQGKEAFATYPLSLWGTYIPEQGAGAKIEAEITNYFFLDISYVRIILLNGIGIFSLMMIHYTKIQYHLAKNRKYYFMLILVIFGLDCAIEHHIIEIAYGLPGFIMFMIPNEAETEIASEKCDVKVKKRKAEFKPVPSNSLSE